MSAERTLMSWVRTAAALIGFGLTLFQFMECLNAMPGIARAAHPEAPRCLGLALLGAGIIGAVIAMWEYRRLVR